MRFPPVIVLLLALALAGCKPALLGSGSSSASGLSPDAVSTGTDASTLPARIAAGAEWLWASYTRLKERVDPAADAMKRLYVAAQEVLVAARAGDWPKALGLYGTARQLVTDIAQEVGK